MVAANQEKLVRIPNGTWAMVAQYQTHKQPEYNLNPMSRALPPALSSLDFAERGRILPRFSVEELTWERHERLDCIERLSRYFDVEDKTIDLYHKIRVLLLSGYLGAERNPLAAEHARRVLQLYQAIEKGGGNSLEDHIHSPTAAPSLTLCGPSGIGKTTNLNNILRLYPQVIVHPDLDGAYQVVWIKIDCPTTSLKGLCIDIFMAFDRLLGTTYLADFGSKSNSVDYMLAQVAQLAHKHYLGVLVIDEMQRFYELQTDQKQVLSFLTKLDNTLGVPVIRVGTNEVEELFHTFMSARRATGMEFKLWDRLLNPKKCDEGKLCKGEREQRERQRKEWFLFMSGLWSYQWTKTFVPYDEKPGEEIGNLFYELTQGIVDVAVKLYKMTQWRAISEGGEERITLELIHQVASESLGPLLPMLQYIREGNQDWKLRFSNVKSLRTKEYYDKCRAELERIRLDEYHARRELKSKHPAYLSTEARLVIRELLNLGVEPVQARDCALQAIASSEDKSDISALIRVAYSHALQPEQPSTTEPAPAPMMPQQQEKLKPNYAELDMRSVAAQASKDKKSVYQGWIEAGLIRDNPMCDLFDMCE